MSIDARAAFTALESTPVPAVQWHPCDRRGHVVQFYSDDAFLLDALSKFIGTALVSGDSAIVIATEEHLDGLAERLRSRGFDYRKASKQSRYITLDASQTLAKFMVDGQPDADRFTRLIGETIERARSAAEAQDSRVVAFGEMVALLWTQGQKAAALRLEQLWNELAKTHTFFLRCAYPMRHFNLEGDAQTFSSICREHSGVIPSESYSALDNDEERFRNIAELQQKAAALENEKSLNEALQRAYEALESEFAEKREAQRKLRESEMSLRQLSSHLLRTQDEERRRLGRELHDTVGQYLAALKMSLAAMRRRNGSKGDSNGQLGECMDLVEQSITEIRTMSYLLYPPMLEEAGLETAILWYLDGFSRRSGIQTTFDISLDFGRLPREVELAIFRVLQESLANVHRHSGSHTADVRLFAKGGAVELEVRDKGKGISFQTLETFQSGTGSVGVGIRGMQERARHLGGELQLFAAGEGTTLVLKIPVEQAVVSSDQP